MNKKSMNILFIFFALFIIISIGFFNYFIDPYGVFQKKNRIYLKFDNHNYHMANILLKADKKNKSRTLIIGGSEINTLFPFLDNNTSYAKTVSMAAVNYRTLYEFLVSYLDIHPETEKIIMLLCQQIFYLFDNQLPEYTGKNYNIEEIVTLLFSSDTIKKSVLKLKNNSDSISTKNERGELNLDIAYPNHFHSFDYSNDLLDKTDKANIFYLDKILNLLKMRKIECVAVIFPSNAALLAYIYKNEYYHHIINNSKRFLVNNNVKVYDMAYANKYTSIDLTSEKNCLYWDFVHPNEIIGAKIFKIFFDEVNDEKDFYFILNQHNINKILEKEKFLIEDYIKKNEKVMNYYKAYSKVAPPDDIFSKSIVIDTNSIPPIYQKELDYIQKKFYENKQ